MALNIFVVVTLILLWQFYRSGFERISCIDAIFACMWVLFSIENYVTNDYYGYCTGFYDESAHVIWEPLYTFLVELCNPMGYVAFNSCVAAFEMFTLCYMFKRFCPKRYLWFGLLIFICDMSNMMTYMCLKRQFFAQMAAMWTLYFMIGSENKRRYLWAIVAFLCAINIHSSAYIALLYFVLPLVRGRMGYKSGIVATLLLAGCMTFQLSGYSDMLTMAFEYTQGNDSDRYGVYIENMEDLQGDYGVGVVQTAFQFFLLIMLIAYNKRVTQVQYWLFLMSITGIMLLSLLVGDLFRLSMYFSIANFFTIPALLDTLDQPLASLRQKALYLFLLLCSLAIAGKSYYNTMTGMKVTYLTAPFKDFPTIFHEAVNPSNYDFDGTREIY
ncbi:MAG: EpsG family protein [Muribaculum sp.]|nr:EpsG family protein [Muribaculaceae bacterium]MCM1080495.1 EpsG family protein [Muribaculum sp.]